MLFGGTFKNYGGANEVNTTGNAVPLSHFYRMGHTKCSFLTALRILTL